MNNILPAIQGVVRGKTIELNNESGLPDGQAVTVTLRVDHTNALPPGEGLARAFGAWSDDEEGLDEFLRQIRSGRQRRRPELAP